MSGIHESHNSSDVASTSASASHDERLKALQAQIAARKRKRAEEAAAATQSAPSDENVDKGKGKARSVSFSADTRPEKPLPTVSDKPVTGILKESTAANLPVKEKTKAKKRYLKRKLERRKAKKKADKGAASSTAGSVAGDGAMDVDQEDEEDNEAQSDQEPLEDGLESRKTKKSKTADQHGSEAADPLATSETDGHALTTDNLSQQDGDADEAARKAERRAMKEAKRAAKQAALEASGVPTDDTQATSDQPKSRREQAQEAKLGEIWQKQAKSKKRAERAGLTKHTKSEEEDAEDNVPPTQPDALPRFPGPVRPAAPSQVELDRLMIAHELRDALVVDQQAYLTVEELLERDGKDILSQNTQTRLKDMAVEKLFAIQAAVLPVLLRTKQLYMPTNLPRDVCVSAPTGSGKTLGYVVPIVEILSQRIVTRLRALIVLPTRDLVSQVREVFEHFCKGTGLKVGVATGQHSFSHEQSALVENPTDHLVGGSSKVDILIVTPGRLMDHLKSTRNFSLQHLRFLVIDEADRLLNQSFNDWLKTVLGHIENRRQADDKDEDMRITQDGDAVAPALLNEGFPLPPTDLDVEYRPSVQKLLFSATLTRDPAKVAALHLHEPIYLAVAESRKTKGEDTNAVVENLLDSERKFVLPATLQENMLVSTSYNKPLFFFHLLYDLDLTNVLCFTKSVEAAARLELLLSYFSKAYVSRKSITAHHYSSELTPARRKDVLNKFKTGEISILVCSDIVARGMDLPSVAHVVNYDAPIDMRKYTHRVGRTARAGRDGKAWTLVETQEAAYFKSMLKEAGRYDKIRKIKIKHADLEKFTPTYELGFAAVTAFVSSTSQAGFWQRAAHLQLCLLRLLLLALSHLIRGHPAAGPSLRSAESDLVRSARHRRRALCLAIPAAQIDLAFLDGPAELRIAHGLQARRIDTFVAVHLEAMGATPAEQYGEPSLPPPGDEAEAGAAAGLTSSNTSSSRRSSKMATADPVVYDVRPIPPYRASSNAASAPGTAAANAGRTRSDGQRERRTSQASTSDTASKRNSGSYAVRYPTPAPSSPASSPTHAQAQFASGPASSSTGSHASSHGRRDSSMGSSSALLQGIEAQLQIPPYRGGPAANTRSRRESQQSQAPGTANAGQQREAPMQAYDPSHASRYSTTYLPTPAQQLAQQQQQRPPHVGAPNVYATPQYLYPTTPSHLSQSTAAYPSVVTSAQTTSAAHAAGRNRASHQIVPISASGSQGHAAQPVNIALHTAQYSSSSKPKVFFGNYQLLHTLGEGEFGKVKLGVHAQRWGEEVAIKLIKKGNIENTARSLKVQREIDVLKVVKHPHIVRLHEVIETDRYIGIVLEYASGGELFEYILAHKHLRENMACKLFAQLISGVAYLHSKKIVHRDLKLENLLLDRNRNIVITDFGFANRFNESGNDLMATSCGSPCYAAPELVLHDGHYVGSAVDVWSCGVILYAMLSGYLPYDDDPANPDGDNINLLYRYITSTQLSFPEWISPEPRELLLMMLVPDPNKRCRLRDVMRHPWLRRYSGFFQLSVEELEHEADNMYHEKQVLLQRQQMEYFRQSQGPSSSMSRSMSASGVDTTAQSRHRSAMVTSTTTMALPELMASMPVHAQRPMAATHIPAPAPTPNRRVHAQSAVVVPTVTSSSLDFIDPFAGTSLGQSAPTLPLVSTSAHPALPTIDSSSLLASAAMTPSTSAPGDVETVSDSLTSEGDLRGEPRSRKTDDDDASTSSAHAPRMPRSPAREASSQDKKRKGDEKRYTVQLEYHSPPPEQTTPESRPRESASKAPEIPALPLATTTLSLEEQINRAASAAASQPRETPVFVPPTDPTVPIIESAAAAETMDVHMQSPANSPAQSLREKEEMVVEQVAPVSVAPKVSPVEEVVEQPISPVSAARPSTPTDRTPPTDEKMTPAATRTPRRHANGTETSNASSDKAATNPKLSQVPFPSPRSEKRRPSLVTSDRTDSRQSNAENTRPPTAGSTRPATRHKKGLSISRFLGSSTTSVDKTDASGQPSHKRSPSTIDHTILDGLKSSTATSSDPTGKSRRRKALSLVVDPFTRSNSNAGTSNSAAKNRRSARIVTSPTSDSLARSGSVSQPSSARTTIPHSATATNFPTSPSVATLSGPSRQSVLGPSYIPQPSTDGNKSKRVSDWFRWKSSTRESGNSASATAALSPIRTDFDKTSRRNDARQSLQIERPYRTRQATAPQPTLVVTAAPSPVEAQSPPPTARVVATPAEARALGATQQPLRNVLTTSRATRSRAEASDGSTSSFDENKLKIHAGATDKRMVTKTSPPLIMEEVRNVLFGMGMEIVKDGDFRYKCTRKSKKQVLASSGLGLERTMSVGLTPSPSSTFRSFFGRKNSSTQTSVQTSSPIMPSPSLSATTATMEGSPESAALSPTLSASSTMPQIHGQPLPYFGSNPQLDSGGEVRFSVEVVRVKGLKGLYTLDLRRLKGSLPDYKENHETFVERLKLASAL